MSINPEIELEKLKIRHRGNVDALGDALGLSPDEQERLAIYGKGIRNGTVRYEPISGVEGVHGRLHVTTQKRGKKKDSIQPITGRAEAAYLETVQYETNRENR